MKNFVLMTTAVLLVFVVMSCGGNGSGGDIESLKKLGETIVSSLKNADIETYLKLCSTTDDEIDYFKSISRPTNAIVKHLASLERERNSRDESYKGNRTGNFNEISKDSFLSGAEIFQIVPDPLKSRLKDTLIDKNMNYCKKITIHFKGSNRTLLIRKIVKFKDGWKITDDYPFRWD